MFNWCHFRVLSVKPQSWFEARLIPYSLIFYNTTQRNSQNPFYVHPHLLYIYGFAHFLVVSLSANEKPNTSKWRFFRDRFSLYLGNYTAEKTDWLSYIRLLNKRAVRVLPVYREMKLVGYCPDTGRSCYLLFPSLLEIYWRNESLLHGTCWGRVFIFISLLWKRVGRTMITIPLFNDYFRRQF